MLWRPNLLGLHPWICPGCETGVQTKENSVRSNIPPYAKVQGFSFKKTHKLLYSAVLWTFYEKKMSTKFYQYISKEQKATYHYQKSKPKNLWLTKRERERDWRASKKILFLKKYFINEVKSNREFLLNFNKIKEVISSIKQEWVKIKSVKN